MRWNGPPTAGLSFFVQAPSVAAAAMSPMAVRRRMENMAELFRRVLDWSGGRPSHMTDGSPTPRFRLNRTLRPAPQAADLPGRGSAVRRGLTIRTLVRVRWLAL